ncbi:SR-related and CTD-associated factor 8 isoform X3 [Cricetulus griseus]|uniref:SR-related and CTD-associated factor 8 isoform X6 n=1 Tax=Cricetulus griseus TaxID=10029 RepID=A0A9J7FHN1_CRIGR|nr:SR-related and CTD-associated factor 8 isoform X6 [Cricetulus griseus]XP_035313243.1 SR-related and CTD-associated factor 8 isoform X3 [Cricetulus griseus]
MEAVKTFNSELYSLNDYKPPISKAKMTQITKAAIKAIKFYKHVVQSVEKFIQKSKIVRVLNLWQKNNVFKSEIIQPLLDMAAGIPPPVVTPVLASTTAAMSNTPGTPVTPVTPANVVQGLPDPWVSQITNTDTLAAVAQILQSPQGQQLQQLIQTLQIQQQKPQPSILQALDAGLVVQLQALTAQLTAAAAAANSLTPLDQGVSFNKKLMDRFDFGEDSEHSEESKKEMPTPQLSHVSESVNNSIFHQIAEQLQQQNLEHLRQQLLEQQQPQKQVTPQDSQEGTFGSEHSASPSQGSSQQHFLEPEANLDDSIDIQQQDMDIDEGQDVVEEEIFEPEAKKVAVRSRSRTHSRSRSRSPRKRRSRSRSGSRKRKHRKRSRSRSRERKRKSSRSYSSERRAREREKERQKKGLPPVRSKTLSVCSTTLWVGQVDKKATQQDLTNLFEEFGQIESINMIPPRGCAYVCMVHRQDSFRALQKLSSGSYKIGSKVIKIAWALNKGVKTEYKQFWDVDLGVTYIPWEKVKVDDLDGFAEGGMIDQETVNAEWETVKTSEPVKETVQTTQSPTPVEKETVVTTQAEVFPPPVAMLQIPVAPAVPAVSLVPPAFPVSMPVPPPGFSPIPPPPFLRASFNPSQPPPGFMPPPVPPPVVPPPAIPPVVPTSLVQPPLSMTPETVKDAGFGGLVLPGGSVASSLAPSALPAGNVFNPPNKAEPEEKVPHLTEHQIPSAENTRPVIPNDIPSSAAMLAQPPGPANTSGILCVQRPNVSSNSEILGVRPANVSSSAAIIGAQPPNILNNSGILGIQPPNVSSGSGLLGVLPPNLPNNSGLVGLQPPNVTNPAGLMGTQPPIGPQNLPPLTIPAQRVPALPMLDIRPGLIPQAPGPRFPLLQPGIPPQRGIPPPAVLDAALHPPPRGPFPPGDLFSQPERPFLAPGRPSLDNVPNPDKRIPLGNDSIQQEGDRDYRFPPVETREGINRPPPVDVRDVVGRPIDPREGPGRPPLDGRDHFGRAPVDMRENLGRPGLDHLGRRDHFGFPPEKPWGLRDFDEREHRVLPVFGGPKGLHEERGRFRAGSYRFDPRSGPWNRGFGQDVPRDFDDRRRPWERQRDRDDRDFDFCREINGNRLGRDRIQNTWVPPPHARVFDYFEGATSQRKGENVPQVNGENTERHAQPPPLPVQKDPELYDKLASSGDIDKEESGTVAGVESEAVVVESTETEGT